MAFIIVINLLGVLFSTYTTIKGLAEWKIDWFLLGTLGVVINGGLLIQNSVKYFGA